MHRVCNPRASTSPRAVVVRVARSPSTLAFVRRTPSRRRRWRRRGRRAQVAAVATILGLLLVVTFIANYLSTTLPQQMSVNDLDHNLQVENQLGRFQALLHAVSEQADLGAQVSQPVTLGSQGLPPFADADSGAIASLNGSSYSLSYQLAGPSYFRPPSTGIAGGSLSGCVLVNTALVVSLTCAAPANPIYNFTGTPTTGFSVSSALGTNYALNFSTNGTSTTAEPITLTTTAGATTMTVYLYGSNDTINLDLHTATTVNLIEFGTNDTVSISATVTGSTVNLLSVGYKDAISITDGLGLKLNAYVAGWADTTTMTTTSGDSSAATAVTVYYTGFTNTTLLCPNDNLAATDSVSGSNSVGTYVAYYNVTTTFTPTAVTHWTQHAEVTTPVESGCPLFYTVTVTSPTAPRFAGLNIHLLNTYAPVADIGLDAGAVVFAQPGGVPQIIDPPGLTVTDSATLGVTQVNLWFPVFIGKGAGEAGVQSAILSARLVALTSFVLTPSSSYTVANNTNIVLTVTTPFASGWWSYFNATYPSSWIACAGHGCYGLYNGLGDFGTVSLTIPTGTNLNYFTVDVATFSFAPT
jgi:hypothetical protein